MRVEPHGAAVAAVLGGLAGALVVPAASGFEIDGADAERLRRGEVIVRAGDFARNEGSWELASPAQGEGTLVKYSVFVEPRFYAPRWLVRRSLEDSVPEVMAALRDRVMATQGAIAARTAVPDQFGGF